MVEQLEFQMHDSEDPAERGAGLFSVAEAVRVAGGLLSAVSAGFPADSATAAGIAALSTATGRTGILSVAVDSRKVGRGSLFVALPGERVDGHDFIGNALEAGAVCVFARSERRPAIEAQWAQAIRARGAALVFVPDTLAALQSLAKAHRSRFPELLRIGITGSSGKTTTKECLGAIFGQDPSQLRRLVQNPGNLNSDIGLCLSVLAINGEHRVGVFEMGMNRKGEMGELADVFDPDIALITNVGTAHIGILGSRQRIAEEKKQVFSRFDGRQTGFVWENDDYNAFLKEGVRGEVLDFGTRTTKGFRGARDLGLEGYEVDWEGLKFRFPLAGRHNLLNAIAAMAIAERVGTPPRDIAAGLSSVRPLFGRSEIFRGRITLVRDCYNANPESIEAAIGLCDGLDWPGRRAYVLGTMLELGQVSEAEHRRLGAVAARSRAQALFFFGEEAKPAFEEARSAGFRGLLVHETDFAKLQDSVRAWLREGDLVLLKASRGMALERLAEGLSIPFGLIGVGTGAGQAQGKKGGAQDVP